MTRLRAIGLTMVLLVVMALVGACAGGSDESASPATDVAEEQGRADWAGADDAVGYTTTTAGGASTGSAPGTTAAALPGLGSSVIKTADVEVQVDDGDFGEAVRSATAIAESAGGYVVTTDVVDRRRGSGTVTMRVPADAFGDALAELHELGEVESERVSGRDVGQEFVDLQARLRNLQAQEGVLLRLMDRSNSIADTLRVQSHLQGVQLEIERLQGRVNYLRDQTDLSTIRFSIVEKGAAATAGKSRLSRAWDEARSVALGVVAAVIVGAGFLLPVAVLVAFVVALVVWLRPRLGWQRP